MFNQSADSILIKADAKLNDKWVFCSNINPQVIASVEEIKVYQFLGQIDTVKVINLDNGAVIYLSKNHGMVKTIDFNKMLKGTLYSIHIDAIPEMNLGIFANDPFNLFDYKIGDRFISLANFKYPNEYQDKYVKTEIISKSINRNNDSLFYEVNIDTLFIKTNNQKDTLKVSSGKTKKNIIFTKNNEALKNQYSLLSNEVNNLGANYTITYNQEHKKYIVKTASANLGIIFPLELYITGWGKAKEFEMNNPSSFWSSSFELLCYNNMSYKEDRQGISFNNNAVKCQDYSDMITSTDEKKLAIDNANIILYPSPVSETLYIQSAHYFNQYRLYNAIGTKVLEVKSINQIDVADLPSGLYLLEATGSDGHKIFKRFEKQ
jgi:hypothetical protein